MLLKRNAKAIIGFVGAALTAVQAEMTPKTAPWYAVSALMSLVTAYSVWRVPNSSGSGDTDAGS